MYGEVKEEVRIAAMWVFAQHEGGQLPPGHQLLPQVDICSSFLPVFPLALLQLG